MLTDGQTDGQTDRQTDICLSWAAFAAENDFFLVGCNELCLGHGHD